MIDLIDLIREKIPHDCFSDTELENLISGTKNRRYALVRRALGKKKIIHVRRGLYCLAEKYRRESINLFVTAQKIYGPSYVSLESALSYHGWIPEAVYMVTSVCAKRSSDFTTPLANFVYRHVSANPLFDAVDLISSESGSFFMARPWKAIADYVFVYKKDWESLDPLVKSLRIDEGLLQNPDGMELQEIGRSFRSRRVLRFIAGIMRNRRIIQK